MSGTILTNMPAIDSTNEFQFGKFGPLYFGTTERFHREVPGGTKRLVSTNPDEAWMAAHDEASRAMRDIRGRDVEFGEARLPEITVHQVMPRKYRLGEGTRQPYEHEFIRHERMEEALESMDRPIEEGGRQAVAFRTNAPLRSIQEDED